jgi:hypothetical protein
VLGLGWLGPGKKRGRESPRVRERRGKRGIGLGQGFGVGLLSFIPFPFLYSNIQTKLFEFKCKLNSNL